MLDRGRWTELGEGEGIWTGDGQARSKTVEDVRWTEVWTSWSETGQILDLCPGEGTEFFVFSEKSRTY